MWTEERYSYQGRSWSMPARCILPKPYQKPHPLRYVCDPELPAMQGTTRLAA